MSGLRTSSPGVRLPTRGDAQLLRAALVRGDQAVAAWNELAAAGGVAQLAGDVFVLAPQLYRNLHDLVPEDPAMGRLRGIYRRTWYSNQLALHAAAQALDALAGREVRALLTGRAATVVSFVHDHGAWSVLPLELAVPPGERPRALSALRGLGWTVAGSVSSAERARRLVRLHLTRAPQERLLLRAGWPMVGGFGPELWSAAGCVAVRGVPALVPGPADQLLLACVQSRRWRPGPLRWVPDALLVLDGVDGRLDWERLVRRARSRRVGPDLATALRYLVEEFGASVPDDVLAGLAKAWGPPPARAVRPGAAAPPVAAPQRFVTATAGRLTVGRVQDFRRLVLDSALVEVWRALEGAGVPAILLKGPAFANWLYPDSRDRPYNDIDLLVAPACFGYAEAVLAGLGFQRISDRRRPAERAHHHEQWRRERGPLAVVIELHRTLNLLPAATSDRLWRVMSSGAGTLELGDVTVTVPSEPACALIVALHAAQHGPDEARAMTDLRRAVEQVRPDVWAAAAELAGEFRAVGAFSAGLALDPAGRDLRDQLGLTGAAASRLVRLRAGPRHPTALAIDRLANTPGVRARCALIIGGLIPSREYMRASSALARRGGWGIAGAYLWRPVALAWAAPRGLLAVLRARGH